MPKCPIAVLILAAGASTRMGTPKQLLPWKNTTLLGNTVQVAQQLTDSVLVVLGSNVTKVRPTLNEKVPCAVNLGWKTGMGSSIALGVQELERMYNPERILVLLVDQPLIDAAYLRKMTAQGPERLVATQYGDSFGVPVLFPKPFFAELKALAADVGARQFLKKYAKSILVLDAEGKSVDLDTPENYQLYFNKNGL